MQKSNLMRYEKTYRDLKKPLQIERLSFRGAQLEGPKAHAIRKFVLAQPVNPILQLVK